MICLLYAPNYDIHGESRFLPEVYHEKDTEKLEKAIYFEGKLEETSLITSITSAINESSIIQVDDYDIYIEYEDKNKKTKNIPENKEFTVPEITSNSRFQDIEDKDLLCAFILCLKSIEFIREICIFLFLY